MFAERESWRWRSAVLFRLELAAGDRVVAALGGDVGREAHSSSCETFDKLRRVAETAVLENKRLGGLLTLRSNSYVPAMRKY